MLSLDPHDIYGYIDKNPSRDLPLMIHYWKIGLYEKYQEEERLLEHLLKFGISWTDSGELISGRLGSEIIKNIYSERQPISIVLKSHILFENFLDIILLKHKLEARKFSFFSKISLLKNKSILKKDIFTDLNLLNQLRNEYGHNYHFDIATFDISQFSICKCIYKGLPVRRKKTKAVLNLKTLQYFVVLNILGRMTYDFPYLERLKIKKISNYLFFEDEAQRIGELVSSLHRLLKGTKKGLKIDITLSDTEDVTMNFHIEK